MNKVRTFSEQDLLPLPLVQLSHKYSLSLSTYMREVEAVLGDLWKEELGNHMIVQNVDPYQDCSPRNSQDQILPRFSTFLNINKLTKEPSCSQVHKISYKSSRSSPSLTRLPTSQDQEVPRYNWWGITINQLLTLIQHLQAKLQSVRRQWYFQQLIHGQHVLPGPVQEEEQDGGEDRQYTPCQTVQPSQDTFSTSQCCHRTAFWSGVLWSESDTPITVVILVNSILTRDIFCPHYGDTGQLNWPHCGNTGVSCTVARLGYWPHYGSTGQLYFDHSEILATL